MYNGALLIHILIKSCSIKHKSNRTSPYGGWESSTHCKLRKQMQTETCIWRHMQIQKRTANCESDKGNVSRGPKKVMNLAVVQCFVKFHHHWQVADFKANLLLYPCVSFERDLEQIPAAIGWDPRHVTSVSQCQHIETNNHSHLQ